MTFLLPSWFLTFIIIINISLAIISLIVVTKKYRNIPSLILEIGIILVFPIIGSLFILLPTIIRLIKKDGAIKN